MIAKIEHIAIAVADLQQSIELWERLLGTPSYQTEEVMEQQVVTAFFKVGDVKIELLASTATGSPIAKFIDRKGPGLHHIAFETDDLASEVQRLEKEHIPLLNSHLQAGAEGKTICFLRPATTGKVLTELCQK